MKALSFLLIVVVASSCFAQQPSDCKNWDDRGVDWKQRIFASDKNDVYHAAEVAIALHHDITMKDPDNMIIRFRHGMTAWSYGYNVSLHFTGQPDKSTLAVATIEKKGSSAVSWGSGSKEVKKVYNWIQEELEKSGKASACK